MPPHLEVTDLMAKLGAAEARIAELEGAFAKMEGKDKPAGWSDEFWRGWLTGRHHNNTSGCACVISDDDQIVRACSLHAQLQRRYS